MPASYQFGDNFDNPEGRILYEYIMGTMTKALLIPDVTCTVHLMTRSKTKDFRMVRASAAKTLDLEADAPSDAGTQGVIQKTVTINKRWFAEVKGAFIPNFTDAEFDKELWAEVQDQLVIQANKDFVTLLKSVAPVFTTTSGGKVTDFIIDAKRQVYLEGKLAPTTLMCSTKLIAEIEKQDYFLPNQNAISLAQGVKGTAKGLTIVEHPYLDEVEVDAIILHPKWIKLLLINPTTQCAIPGMVDEVQNGMIIRTDKPRNNITSFTTVQMPFGLDVIDPFQTIQFTL